ncbi:MAG TPA: urease accessory UreF family protein [Tepidisphaeraceae bacterium]|nr:urease accessory UreF family protein [Tepidisphaeraceae bacterium]
MLQWEQTGEDLAVSDWLIFQLCDSAFPAGGFAHSNGLEAAWQHRRIDSGAALDGLIRCQLNQSARGTAPFVAAAYRCPDRFEQLDALCDALLSNHVANRASRAQGQAFVLAVSRIFFDPSISRWAADVRKDRSHCHLSPAFGAACRRLDLALEQTVRLFLFLSVRSSISSAVRLGIVGPLEAQALQHRAAIYAETMVSLALSIAAEDAAQPAPLMDLLQGTHDRLYSRLFQS